MSGGNSFLLLGISALTDIRPTFRLRGKNAWEGIVPETQSYKLDTSFAENALAAVAGTACIALPFVAWFMGWAG
jgi:hypothetical protein